MRFVRGHECRKFGEPNGFGIRVLGSRGFTARKLQHRHALQDPGHVLEGAGSVQARIAQGIAQRHHLGTIPLGQGFDEWQHAAAIGRAQHLTHRVLLQLTGSIGDGLVGQRQGIAHGAAGGTRDPAQGLGVGGYVLGLQHPGKV